MSHDTALTSPDRASGTGVPTDIRPGTGLVVETFDGWGPDLSTPLLASVCMRAEAASR